MKRLKVSGRGEVEHPREGTFLSGGVAWFNVDRMLSIGQVSERTGLSVHALRFYEREGILAHPVSRESNGRRLYSDFDVEWLTLCTRLRASGMPLPAIRAYAELVRQGEGNEKDRLELLHEHQERVAAQIEELRACQEMIGHKVRWYEQALAGGGGDPLVNDCPR